MSKVSDSSVADKQEQLSDILNWFESDKFDIDMASDKVQEARDLLAEIEAMLKSQKNRIEIIKQKFEQSEQDW